MIASAILVLRRVGCRATSSASFTEGRIAGKAAVKYVMEKGRAAPELREQEYRDLEREIYQPLETHRVGRNEITAGTVSPSYLLPIHGRQRLEKVMVWELHHGLLASESVTQHTLFREETRWPGYYCRGDHMKLDDENWRVFTLSRYDAKSGHWQMEKAPVYHIVD